MVSKGKPCRTLPDKCNEYPINLIRNVYKFMESRSTDNRSNYPAVGSIFPH